MPRSPPKGGTKRHSTSQSSGGPPKKLNEKVSNAVAGALALAAQDPPPGVPSLLWETITSTIRLLSFLLEEQSSPYASPSPLPLHNHPPSSLPVSLFPPPSLSPSSALPYSADSYEDHLRMRSIVISGVPESADPCSVARAEADVDEVKKILAALGLECVPQSVFRMGKQTPDRPRLLKVLLPSRSHLLNTLSVARNLRSLSEFPNVYIRKSMTANERAAFTSLRAHLKSLRESNPNCPYVIYRDQIWHKDDIKGKQRIQLPPDQGNESI